MNSYPASPERVDTWWNGHVLYIRVWGHFEGPGKSLSVLKQTSNPPTFTLLETYDGSPANNQPARPYDIVSYFDMGKRSPLIYIDDAKGRHPLKPRPE